MPLRGKKLGLLISVPPAHPNFGRGIRLAEAALDRGVQVYLYCIDEAVDGLDDPRLHKLKISGLKMFACAYGAQRRSILMGQQATFGGLTLVSDLIAATERFVSFN
jgi:hypothetical protein